MLDHKAHLEEISKYCDDHADACRRRADRAHTNITQTASLAEEHAWRLAALHIHAEALALNLTKEKENDIPA
jgi:hypothetical protein